MLLLGKCGGGCDPVIVPPPATNPAPVTTVAAPPSAIATTTPATTTPANTAPAPTTSTKPPTPTTTTVKPTTTTTPPTTAPATTAPATTAPAVGHFSTLPPGAALPSDATCAAAVRSAKEIHADNNTANHTIGTITGSALNLPGVTGNFTGTTDQIIQWVACKWGVDEDIVRAQIAKESWWHQNAGGDRTNDPSLCYPDVRGTLPCPESVGLGQVRFAYHGDAFANSNTIKSSAYNLDYTYFKWRSCYNGNEGWLNQFERGQQYAAGDVWGCVGLWFSGRWHTQPAEQYITAVKDYLAQRIWTTQNFVNG